MKIEFFSRPADELRAEFDRTEPLVIEPLAGGSHLFVDGREVPLAFEPALKIETRLDARPVVRLLGAIVDEVTVHRDGVLIAMIPRYPTFVVEDIFEIRGRGVVISRDEAPAADDWRAGSLFAVGGDLYCVGRPDLAASIGGIEHWMGGSPMRQGMQQALLLRGVERADVEVGQTWKMWRSDLRNLLVERLAL